MIPPRSPWPICAPNRTASCIAGRA
jgi:hypothetical protein